MTLDDFFAGYAGARPIFDALRAEIEASGDVEMLVTKSQIAFRSGTAFAWAWVPDRYLGGGRAPLVMSVTLSARDASPRWKQVVEPAAGRFMHHLELRSVEEIDDDVREWLRRAREEAVRRR
jgi:hypothetical protein